MAARLWTKRRWKKWVLWLLLALACYVAAVYGSIVWQSGRDESRGADAIVVFGAAEYDGRPSPVYKARLDHAAQLYHRGLAPMVIITGGSGGDPKFTEGVVGREYLKTLGIPDTQLIAETQSSDTAESARRVATIMYVNSMHSCLPVRYSYHIFRIHQMLALEAVIVSAATRPTPRP